jgi:hypothetical protein
MVAMKLYVLKTMTWYLKIVFGQSKILFGSAVWTRPWAWARDMVQPLQIFWLYAH